MVCEAVVVIVFLNSTVLNQAMAVLQGKSREVVIRELQKTVGLGGGGLAGNSVCQCSSFPES